VQMVAVCDCNRMSKDYVEYSANALLKSERRLLGPGYETWGEDLASPGEVQISHRFKYSMGAAGREPAQRLVEAFYAAHKPSGRYHGCSAYTDYRQLLEKEKDLDAVYIATPDHWHAPMSIAAMRKHKHVLCQKPMTHSISEAHRVAHVARRFPHIAQAQPATRDLALPAVRTNDLCKYSIIVADTVAHGRVVQRCHGIQEARRQTAETAIPQTRVDFLGGDVLELVTHASQDSARFVYQVPIEAG